MKRKDLKENLAEQGTIEWRKGRLGKFTSTRIDSIMKAGRGKDQVFGDTAISMIAEVAAERILTDDVLNDEDMFKYWSDLQCKENSAMRYGHDNEGCARNFYEMDSGNEVIEVGVIDHPTVPFLAGSPDGIVCDKKGNIVGCVEIKCPSTTKACMRYRWFINDAESLKKESSQYYWQVQNTMNVTGAKWCDFIVFSPFINGLVHVVRIERNEDDIAAINERVKLANEYIDQMNGGQKDDK